MTWDEHADSWDEDAAVQAFSNAAFASLEKLEKLGRLNLGAARILDFGCGTGLLAEKLLPGAKNIVAVDTSVAMIRILESKAASRGLDNLYPIAESIDAAMATHPGLFAAAFDLVACSSVCAFLEDYPGTVRTLSKLLRPGGAFVQWDWELDPNSEELFGLTHVQIEEALIGAELTGILVEVAFDVEIEGEHMRPLLGFGVREGAVSSPRHI